MRYSDIFFSITFFKRNLTIYSILRLSLIFNKYRYNNIIIIIEFSLIKSFIITFNIDIAVVIISSLLEFF